MKKESLSGAPTGSAFKLEFKYDARGRRIYKKVTDLGNSTVVKERKFIYDGWNLYAELNGSGSLVQSYIWGPDLSGTREGAGGVGGLVGVKPAGQTVHFVAYDGNGNVMGLVDGSDGTISARYEYGPFAEPIRVTGAMGEVNPFRFSTKYTDEISGFLYYGYRFYDPVTGRWLNRDPLDESGFEIVRDGDSDGFGDGPQIYYFVWNDPLSRFDPLGLAYFAYRPLDSAFGKLVGVGGNKLDDKLNTMVAHEQLFFEDGGSPGNLGFFDDNQVRSDKSPLKYEAGHDTGWNDCVMRKAVAKVKPSTYCLLGKLGKTEKYNRQDWVDSVRAEYRRLIKDPAVISQCCPSKEEKSK